jgi:hypothetical protein
VHYFENFYQYSALTSRSARIHRLWIYECNAELGGGSRLMETAGWVQALGKDISYVSREMTMYLEAYKLSREDEYLSLTTQSSDLIESN